VGWAEVRVSVRAKVMRIQGGREKKQVGVKKEGKVWMVG
jgi:hypothetical protein